MNTVEINKDKCLIESHGGSTALAKTLNYQVQRVQNWKIRGIPASIKLKYPHLFLSKEILKDHSAA